MPQAQAGDGHSQRLRRKNSWLQQRRRARDPDAMQEAAAELLRGVKQQSRKTKKIARAGDAHSKRRRQTNSCCSRATGPDAMLEAAAELLRGVKQQSRNTRKRGRAGDADSKPRRQANSCCSIGELQQRRRATGPDAMLEAAAELLSGVKQQSWNTRKTGRATGSDAKFKLDATGPRCQDGDGDSQRQRHKNS